jgi:hypothetical protein
LGRYFGERFLQKYGTWFGVGMTEVSYLKKGINRRGFWAVMASKFHGMGPRFGADVHYHLSNEFGLASHVSTSLLAGTFSTKYNGEKVNVSESMNGIVPNVGAKLGIDYTYTMSNDSKSLVVFEAGYQTDHNFKVLDNCVDTSFNGPYVDVKYYA